ISLDSSGKPIPVTTSVVGSLDPSTLSEGPHTLTATVTDAAGHTVTSAPVPFTVSHQPSGPRAVADWTGDGNADLLTAAGGQLWLSAGDGQGQYGAPVSLSADPAWNGAVAVAVSDFTGGGVQTLIATHADGSMYVAAPDATGKLSAPRQVLPATQGFTPTFL